MLKKKKLFKSLIFSSAVSASAYYVYSLNKFEELFNANNIKTKSTNYYDTYIHNKDIRDIDIKNINGINLHGKLILNNNNHKFIIMIHDLNEDMTCNYEYIYHFDKYEYNYLIIDNRGFGLSQGKYITYGFKESFDLLSWINYLTDFDKNAKICLFGRGFGACSLMIALNSKLNNNVKCAIEFAGFTDFKSYLNNKLLYAALDILLFEDEKISLKDISPIKAIKNNYLPICFVHNKNDEKINYSEGLKLYNANPGYKKFYPLDGGHLNTSTDFYNNLNAFILEQFSK